MPLYSYVVTYKGESYADQQTQSNFKGFVSKMVANMPIGALPEVTAALHKEMIDKAMRQEWQKIPNRKNIWKSSFDLNGHLLTIFAIDTKI